MLTYKSSEWWKALPEGGAYAVEHINAVYGDRVKPKWKTLKKFGRKSLPAKETKYTIMSQGSTAIAHETYPTANTIDTVVASTTGQTQTITVEGHTIDTSGDLTFVTQDVTLTGSTGATLTTPLARCTRMTVKSGTWAAPTSDLAAAVYAYQSTKTGLTGGVPSSASHVNCIIPSGYNQSEKCATSISKDDYWVIDGIQAALPEGASPTGTAAVDIDLEIRDVKGGVFKPQGAELSVGASFRTAEFNFKEPIVVPPNSDVRLTASASTTDVVVTGAISGYLLAKASSTDFS